MEKIWSWWTEYRRLIVFMAIIALSVYGAWVLFGKLLILAVCAFAIWYARKYREDLAKTEWQDWINPVKWASVLFASFTKMLFPQHIVEQLILRMYDKECIRCTRAGTCFACGCDSSKMYVPWEECFNGNWGGMFESAKEYRAHRSEFPVQIDVIHLTEETVGPFDSGDMWSKEGLERAIAHAEQQGETVSGKGFFELMKEGHSNWPADNKETEHPVMIGDLAVGESKTIIHFTDMDKVMHRFVFSQPMKSDQEYEYELYIGPYHDNPAGGYGWFPIDKEGIGRPDYIQWYIDQGVLRLRSEK
jgi:hypothetical protein